MICFTLDSERHQGYLCCVYDEIVLILYDIAC